jgi:hypothetical protein
VAVFVTRTLASASGVLSASTLPSIAASVTPWAASSCRVFGQP